MKTVIETICRLMETKENHTLAVDIWAVVCMGLRTPDFERVYFKLG